MHFIFAEFNISMFKIIIRKKERLTLYVSLFLLKEKTIINYDEETKKVVKEIQVQC